MYKTSFIFIAKKCQSLWKKNRMQTIIFFHFVLCFLHKLHVNFNKKNQETLFIVSGEQIWTKRRNERQRFSYYIITTRPLGHQQKVITKTVQGWFLPVCFSPAILHMITLKTLISQESWSPQYLKNLNLVLVTSQAIFHVFILLGFLQAFYLC